MRDAETESSSISVDRTRWAGSHPSKFLSSASVAAAVTAGGAALLYVGILESSLLSTMSIWLLFGAIGTGIIALERLTTKLSMPVSLTRIFWVTFGWRTLGIALLHVALSYTPYWPWWDFGSEGGDEFGFWRNSDRLVWAWQNGSIWAEEAAEYANYYAWLHIISFVRYLSSLLGVETVFNVRLVLALASALIVPYVYALCLRTTDEKVARTAAIVTFWLPEFWFYSSTLLRDVLIATLMIMIYYQVVAALRGDGRSRLIVALFLNFGVLRYLRFDVAYINIAILPVFAMYDSTVRRGRFVLGSVLILTSWLALMGLLAPEHLPLFAPSYTRFSTAEGFETRITAAQEVGLDEASTDSFGAVLLNLPAILRWPLATAFILLQPVPPWAALHGGTDMFPLKMAMSTIVSSVWFCLAMFLPVGFIHFLRANRHPTVWIWGTAAVLLLSMGFVTAAHPRWRLMVMPFLVILIAQGIRGRKQHPFLLLITIAPTAVALSMYSILKYLR